jgi:hypothetical protein
MKSISETLCSREAIGEVHKVLFLPLFRCGLGPEVKQRDSLLNSRAFWDRFYTSVGSQHHASRLTT